MLLKTFTKGGIHPPDNKISSGKEIEKLPVPENVTIPVSQHIGAPSKVLVKRGDAVKTGQLIAESTGFVSANTHSSVTGTVVKIDSVTDTSGYRRPAVVIKTEEDEWTDGVDLSADLKKECQLEKDEIIRKILEAGIVGLGGATFPSHVKLSVPKGKKAEYLILNGVECEPYLTADHALMLEKGEEILAGARILMKAMGVEKCIIGIENNKPDALAHLSTLKVMIKG